VSAPEILARIAAAKRAVLAQTELLHREFGRAESKWKSDGTRVTAVDVAISENIFRDLAAEFPADQFLSEELADSTAPIAVTAQFAWVLDPIDGTNTIRSMARTTSRSASRIAPSRSRSANTASRSTASSTTSAAARSCTAARASARATATASCA
jgi:hypothetical protein